MKHTIQNEQTKNQLIEIERSFWTGRIQVKADGVEAPKLSKKEFSYYDKDGVQTVVTVKGSEFTKVEVTIGSYHEEVVRPLKAYEYILAFIPVFMIILGGAIGGGLAGVGIFSLMIMMRKLEHVILKIIASLVVTGIVYVLWYIIASVVLEMMGLI